MDCGCIPPPPDFDLPPPPDPSLIWDLLSDEPIAEFLELNYGQCEFNPVFNVLKGNEVYVSVVLCVLFIITAVGFLVGALIYRRRRNNQKRCPSSSLNSTTKTNSGSAETVVTANQWPYGQKVLSPQMIHSPSFYQPIVAQNSQGALIRSLPLCHNQKFVNYPQIAAGNFPQTCQNPCQNPGNFAQNTGSFGHHHPNCPPNFQTMPYAYNNSCCMHSNNGYCTLSSQPPHYEEIHHEAPHYAANPIHDPQRASIADLARRPPPQCRPPPPPVADNEYYLPPNVHINNNAPIPRPRNQQSSQSTLSDENSDLEGYLNHAPQLGAPHCAVDPKGRESGYGTGEKRPSGSKMSHPRSPLSQSSPPNRSVTVTQKPSPKQNMTYV
ncbi:unnamed protein product [Bursaphelenchus xylophilus]|uniref:(pine wood nematode) hypothetical protein n=1 Tax=Bursaphelenchus xylophilus TaxID=6326 RepID=A0A1I7RX91_BURXY|nr:unnamed protein product [Bursaphelenchus xylophilus]CAG9121441.1 unnamed protein product [Bursaphelenchus xylophilus]